MLPAISAQSSRVGFVVAVGWVTCFLGGGSNLKYDRAPSAGETARLLIHFFPRKSMRLPPGGQGRGVLPGERALAPGQRRLRPRPAGEPRGTAAGGGHVWTPCPGGGRPRGRGRATGSRSAGRRGGCRAAAGGGRGNARG